MTYIETKQAPAAIGPYVQARWLGNLLFLSGQLGLDTKTGELLEGDIAQLRQALSNAEAILTAGGLVWDDAVKITLYLTDMSRFGVLNEVYAEFFGEALPARCCIAVADLPRGAVVEVDIIAGRAS